jgi:ectoine hydroxylase-related dioxygenase (phytanoyl-CoA dioxygenase family)
MSPASSTSSIGWYASSDCDVEQFRAVVEIPTDHRSYPNAHGVETDVVFYEAGHLVRTAEDETRRRILQAELANALMLGPGIVAVRGAFDCAVVDRMSEVFEELLAAERHRELPRGDHYAPPGANERLWDALGKVALRSPEAFADYYANPLLPLVAEAWLGPGYQVTSAVNVVNPGGAAQSIHCDYHLGFQTDEQAAAFPAHVHKLSQALTLQGAIAHSDMPVESGPTLYIPHSQKYRYGYLAWRLPQFVEYSAAHHVQPALDKGDAVFFNPAVFHAAGHNRTQSRRRMANLLQISSPFGRAMESIDRDTMVNAVFPVLVKRRRAGEPITQLRAVVAACAEGYPFPTNLDRDVPVDSLTPSAQVDLVWRALVDDWSPHELRRSLEQASERKQADPWPATRHSTTS